MTNLFKELMEDGEAAIDGWIADRMGEGIEFDCKRKENDRQSKLDTADRRHLGKSLSAFANSGGGLLLWGVDARDFGGVDRLVGKFPIADLSGFRSKIERAISELISPPISGIQFYEIEAYGGTGSGYLAISIPLSEGRPHMSLAPGERGFYFRNGHSSDPMTVYHVRDQMLRRTQAELGLRWDVRVSWQEARDEGGRASAQWKLPVDVDLLLDNISSVSARAPHLKVVCRTDAYRDVGPAEFADNGLPIARSGPLDDITMPPNTRLLVRSREFGRGAEYCVHPGMSIRVATIRIKAPARPHFFTRGRQDYVRLGPDFDKLPVVAVDVSYACMDSAVVTEHLTVRPEHILQRLVETGQSEPVPTPYRR